MLTDAAATRAGHWTDGLTPQHWRILWGSFLGWIFDGYEAFALVSALPTMLHSILTPQQMRTPALYAGWAIGITLLGWGIGGLAGGVLADYVGRRKVMLYAVFFYALFTGLTAFSSSFAMLAALRFITGLAIGSEWSTGIALVAESWPDRARPKGCGFLQSGFGWGSLLAALVWFGLSRTQPLGAESWRLMFAFGALPAFLVLYLRRHLGESERWLAAVREHRWGAVQGTAVTGTARPFTLSVVFRTPESRRRVILATLLSVATTVGWWAVSSWLPLYSEQLAHAQGLPPGLWGPRVAILYTVGAVAAYLVSGFAADALGRRWYLTLTYGGALASTYVSYLWGGGVAGFAAFSLVNGFFTLGCAYAWMAIYPVELFTASVRASAASVIFNGARLIGWVFPVLAGAIVASFGGIVPAALTMGSVFALGLVVPWFLPETNGLPLPD